jgi:predicted small secreted protein
MLKRITMLAIVVFLAGCNTMEGVGKDLKQGGEAIQKAVTK